MMVALVVRTLLAQSVALRTARSAHRTSMRSVTSSCSWNLMPSVWMMSRPGAWRLSGLESQLTWSGMKASFLLRQDWRRLFWVQGDAGLRVLSEICFAGLPLSICDSCLTWFLLWFQKVSCRSWKKIWPMFSVWTPHSGLTFGPILPPAQPQPVSRSAHQIWSRKISVSGFCFSLVQKLFPRISGKCLLKSVRFLEVLTDYGKLWGTGRVHLLKGWLVLVNSVAQAWPLAESSTLAAVLTVAQENVFCIALGAASLTHKHNNDQYLFSYLSRFHVSKYIILCHAFNLGL